jgi:hypothetical protein
LQGEALEISNPVSFDYLLPLLVKVYKYERVKAGASQMKKMNKGS